MRAVVAFLEENTLESDKIIFEDMTLKTLAEQAFDEVLDLAKRSDDLSKMHPVPFAIKEKIGTLMSSRDMNPALFFSSEFKLGVYMPILAPFIVPIILTISLVARHRLYLLVCKGKDKKVDKEKTD